MGLKDIKKKIEENIPLTPDDGLQLADFMVSGKGASLLARAEEVQRQFHGPIIEFCAITNAKSGACPHNCSFCAQSSHHRSLIKAYPLRQPKGLLEAAQAAQKSGTHRFSIVTSGARLSKEELLKVCEAIRLIKQETALLPCASLGKLGLDEALLLKEAGLVRYHHNLETNRDFYPKVCTTQTYEDRLSTIHIAREAGLEICVGGILGLGESLQDRVNFALEIKHLNPDSIPLNFLDPRPGTPLEVQPLLTPDEVIMTVALFRIIIPDVPIRLAGGRAKVLGDQQAAAIKAGISGLIIGDYLTTKGSEIQADHEMIASLNLKPSIIKQGVRACN
ncbi:MAG: biotin synthase BioB [Thermodesulfobacteriota bacterium]|nr:biotin synthase BioB [Thermodesulfobacteriota bacterium]